MTILEQQEKNKCLCVTKHVPLPIRVVEIEVNEEKIYLCPTSFNNMARLRELYQKHGGRPPGNLRKHFSDYIQNLVQLSYDNNQNP